MMRSSLKIKYKKSKRRFLGVLSEAKNLHRHQRDPSALPQDDTKVSFCTLIFEFSC